MVEVVAEDEGGPGDCSGRRQGEGDGVLIGCVRWLGEVGRGGRGMGGETWCMVLGIYFIYCIRD